MSKIGNLYVVSGDTNDVFKVGEEVFLSINAKDIKDNVFAENILSKAKEIFDKTNMLEKEMIELIDTKI